MKSSLIWTLGDPSTAEFTPNLIIFGNFWPTQTVSAPLVTTTSRLREDAAEHLLNSLLRNVGLAYQLKLTNSVAPYLREPALLEGLVDPQAKAQLLLELKSCTSASDDAQITQAREGLREAPPDPATDGGARLIRHLQTVGETVPTFAPVCERVVAIAHAEPKVATEVVAQLNAILATATKLELVSSIEQELSTTTASNRDKAKSLATNLDEFAEAHAALELLCRNLTKNVRVTLFSVDDAESWLAAKAEEFLGLITRQGSTHVDVLLANSLRDPRSLWALEDGIEKLNSNLVTVHAGLSQYRTPTALLERARACTPRGNRGAGSTRVVVGKTKVLTEVVSPVAATVGLRLSLDDRIEPANRLHGLLEPGFGHRAVKRLLGCDDTDSNSWPEAVHQELTELGFCAASCNPSSGTVGLYSNRSRSSLPDYLFADHVRAVSKIVSKMMRYLQGEGIGAINEPAVHRHLADTADRLCVQPWRGVGGFDGQVLIDRPPGSVSPRLNFTTAFAKLVPVEQIEAVVRMTI